MKSDPNIELISRISSESFMPFAYGGGIRDLNIINKILRQGAEKVIINTFAVESPQFIKNAAENFGSQSIIVSIDVKKKFFGKYEVFIYSRTKSTDLKPNEFAKKMEDMGAGELFIIFIDRDGMMNGYDTEIIREISNFVSIPVIACGGAGTPLDLKAAVSLGQASAVAAGSLIVFYGSRKAVLINYLSQNKLLSVFD